MVTSNWRIFLAIVLSLFILFSINYFYKNPQILRPENILAGIIQKTEGLKTRISSIKLPDFSKIFTLNFNPSNNVATKQWGNQSGNSFSLPTVARQNYPSPTYVAKKSPIYQPTPTTKPYPTAYKKPTSPPPPTDIPAPPPVTSNERPGTSMAEIFDNVSKRMCVPAALLHAFQSMETGTGPWVKYNDSSSAIKIYNTYGWWKTGTGNPCYGLGYHTQTGIVPQDSVNAGKKCMNATGSPNDLGIMGILQISQWEQDVSRKNTISTLPKNIDRRVLFDNAIIFASITKNRVGNLAPNNCDDWPDEAVRTAAEKHAGNCTYYFDNGTSTDYCSAILKFYKQYK